jgi:hypothetical protein
MLSTEKKILYGALALTLAGTAYAYMRSGSQKSSKDDKLSVKMREPFKGPWVDAKGNEVVIPLEKTDAIARKEVVSDVEYTLTLALSKGGKTYEGFIKIKMKLSRVTQDLFLNYQGNAIQSFKINGKGVNCSTLFHDHKVYLPSHMLEKGENYVRNKF